MGFLGSFEKLPVITSCSGIIELHRVSLKSLNSSGHNKNPTGLQAAPMTHSVDLTHWGVVTLKLVIPKSLYVLGTF